MFSDIQAIFFDLGDTLVRIKSEILQVICDAIGKARGNPLEVNEYMRVFQDEWNKRQKPLDKELIKGVVTHADEVGYWKNFFHSLLITLEVSSYQERLAESLAKIYSHPGSFECFEDVHEVLAELKVKGLKLGVISNAFPSAEKIINQLELKQYFDYILLSYDFKNKNIKPEPEIYQFAVDALNVDVDKSIFVDDRWAFVKAARDLGMDSYLIERFSTPKRNFTTGSLVPRINNLFELRDKILGENKRSEQILSPSENKKERENVRSQRMPVWVSP